MAPPAPFKRIFSTGRAPPPPPIEKLNQIASTAASSAASNTLPRFELAQGCLSIQAIQASMDHTESGEMWCVRVQLQNISSDRKFEQLKLSLAFDTTSSSTNCDGVTLTCHTQSIYLSSNKSTCLAIKLPNSTLPISWTEIPLTVHLSWFEAKQWTELHPIALLRLSRWNPQPILLQPPTTSSLTSSSTPSLHPLISIMDQVHRLDLSWRAKGDEEGKSSSMTDTEEALNEQMKQLLTQQFALIQPDSSASNLSTLNLRTMAEWIRDSRSSELMKLNQSIGPTDLFLIRPQESPTAESLTLHLASNHETMTVFGPSPAALIRFFHQLKAALEVRSFQLQLDPSSSLAQLATRDVQTTLERTLQTTIQTLQKCMPAVAVEQLPTTPITLTPQQCLSYLHQTLPLQLQTPDLGALPSRH